MKNHNYKKQRDYLDRNKKKKDRTKLEQEVMEFVSTPPEKRTKKQIARWRATTSSEKRVK